MWSVGRFDLGLSDEEFWSLTLAEYDALVKRLQVKCKQDDARVAMICCILANVNRDPKKRSKPYEIKDFMPKYGDSEQGQSEPQSWQNMHAVARMLNRAFGGVERVREEK